MSKYTLNIHQWYASVSRQNNTLAKTGCENGKLIPWQNRKGNKYKWWASLRPHSTRPGTDSIWHLIKGITSIRPSITLAYSSEGKFRVDLNRRMFERRAYIWCPHTYTQIHLQTHNRHWKRHMIYPMAHMQAHMLLLILLLL